MIMHRVHLERDLYVTVSFFIMLASQQPSQVMKAVYANTFIKIFGNLSSGRELESIAKAMGLKGGGCTCSVA